MHAAETRGRPAWAVTVGLLLLAVRAGAADAPEPTLITLHELLGAADTSVDVRIAGAEFDAAEADWKRERAESGWKLAATAGYGTTRDIIDETRTRSYDAVQTRVGLTYPLLGSLAREQREVEMAAGVTEEKRLKHETARKIGQLEIEDVYAALWGAQAAIQVIDAYLAPLAAGSTDDDDSGPRRARAERRRLANRAGEAQRKLEQRVGRPLPGIVAAPVQLPEMPELDTRRLEHDHPELASLRNEYRSTRQQLDDSVWWGVDASFDVTQSTITDRDDSQAGNALYANVNLSLPLSFFESGTQERRRLRSQMEALELKLKAKSGEVVASAQGLQAEHRAVAEEVTDLAARRERAGKRLRQADTESGRLAQRRRDYAELALDEIDARTRYWRSHVELRSYIPVGAADPAPQPPGPTVSDLGRELAEPLSTRTSP